MGHNDEVCDLMAENGRLKAENMELAKALEGMLEWARRVRHSNPGNEVARAITAIVKHGNNKAKG